uniref:ATP synthase F0 subunit 8 n=1 Tax=Cipangopaludina cathayensis TaxID=570432 RepID=A0A1D9CQT4_9CAEN|nr:ATP synthase F0 subunit 8 [Cipangopaludina cathayensis]
MPQLSPLSWIFLFMFFWVVVLMTAILIWWMKKFECNLNVGEGGMIIVMLLSMSEVDKNACGYLFYFWWS